MVDVSGVQPAAMADIAMRNIAVVRFIPASSAVSQRFSANSTGSCGTASVSLFSGRRACRSAQIVAKAEGAPMSDGAPAGRFPVPTDHTSHNAAFAKTSHMVASETPTGASPDETIARTFRS